MFCSVMFMTSASSSVFISMVYHHAACAANVTYFPSAENVHAGSLVNSWKKKNMVLFI